MADTGEIRSGVVGDAAAASAATRSAVVHSLAAVVQRPCARPHCSAPARATLTFNYASRDVWLERLADEPRPQAYDLCVTHAARTRPPHGWQLRDRRPEDERLPDVPPPTPADLGGDRTVAVLAAALRAVPDPVSEDAVDDDTTEVGPGVGAPAPAATAAESDPTRSGRGEHEAAEPKTGPQPRPVLAARRRPAGRRPPAADEAQTW